MTDDQREAHKRLLCKLPVRTHVSEWAEQRWKIPTLVKSHRGKRYSRGKHGKK